MNVHYFHPFSTSFAPFLKLLDTYAPKFFIFFNCVYKCLKQRETLFSKIFFCGSGFRCPRELLENLFLCQNICIYIRNNWLDFGLQENCYIGCSSPIVPYLTSCKSCKLFCQDSIFYLWLFRHKKLVSNH